MRRKYREPFSLDFDTYQEDGPLGTKCLIWKWAKTKEGYGVLKLKGKLIYAHRFFFELLVGRIPQRMYVGHICERKSCVNPEHLEVCTMSQNLRYFHRGKR